MADKAMQVARTTRVYNPSAMVERPGFLLRLIGRAFFQHVTFDVRSAELVRSLDRQGTVVYVMSSHSLLDYLYFNWAFSKLGLPLAQFANGVRLVHALLLRPLGEVVAFLFAWMLGRARLPESEAETLDTVLPGGGAALLFLKRPRAVLQWGGAFSDEALIELLRVQRHMDRPIMLLPQFLVWKQQPERYRRSVVDMVFGQPDAPGMLRKIISFVRNHRRAFVRMGDAVDLKAFLAEQEASFGDDAQLAGKLRWQLHRQFQLEAQVIKGPVLKDSRRIRAEIVRNEQFREELEALAVRESIPKEKAFDQARRYLKEMAADFRMAYVEMFCMVLAIIWNRIYVDIEVDEEGLDRLRQAAKKAPLIVVPTHRSHIDYLIISYLFYTHGLIPPHIAAGINLSFFPMGHLFRHAGAFFIRRSFRDNHVYSLAFRYYIRKLVKEGYWIEFFPEGGRSRTGKVLPPRVGMLRELVEAVETGVTQDLMFCPVSIAYEKIIEERSYTRELSGGEKQAETMGSVLRATKVLASRYGRLYVRFAEPISAQEFLTSFEAERPDSKARESEGRRLKELAYRLLDGMNRAAVVTPSSVVAMVLLAHPRSGISREQLLLRTGYLIEYFTQKGATLSRSLDAATVAKRALLESPPAQAQVERTTPGQLAYGSDLYRARVLARAVDDVVEETLQMFIKAEALEVFNYGDELAYSAAPRKRINLDFYKNNALHLVTHEAILSTALLATRSSAGTPKSELHGLSKLLSRLFRQEFVYRPGQPFDVQFDETLRRFAGAGWVIVAPDGTLTIREGADELIVFFANCIHNYVEGYHTALVHAHDQLRDAAMSEKAWLKSLQQRAERLLKDRQLRYQEGASTAVFKNALEIFVETGIVHRFEEAGEPRRGKRSRPEKMLRVGPEQLTALHQVLPELERALMAK